MSKLPPIVSQFRQYWDPQNEQFNIPSTIKDVSVTPGSAPTGFSPKSDLSQWCKATTGADYVDVFQTSKGELAMAQDDMEMAYAYFDKKGREVAEGAPPNITLK